MDAAAFQTVFTSRTQSEADVVIGLLRSVGLHPPDLLTSPHIGFAGAEFGYRVEIPSSELEAARRILCEADITETPSEPGTGANGDPLTRV